MKSGYLYVLEHPSDPNLVKIGHTTRKPEQALAQHNSDYNKIAGQIVKKTGQKCKLKEYIAVPDPAYAKAAFWETTCSHALRGHEDVTRMQWDEVQMCLDVVKNAGVRPPKELPDHVYAYTAWMKKRLEGRDIALIGHVKSKFGKATFKCMNGHEWQTRPDYVAEGEGCPQCGIGERDPEEMRRAINPACLCLLTHPDKPRVIKIGLTYGNEENVWDDWEVHRYRNVEEEPVLAESLIWELLGTPKPNDSGQIEIDLRVAEQAFRDLIYQMRHEIALAEKVKEDAK